MLKKGRRITPVIDHRSTDEIYDSSFLLKKIIFCRISPTGLTMMLMLLRGTTMMGRGNPETITLFCILWV